jgi:hypothetical protein
MSVRWFSPLQKLLHVQTDIIDETFMIISIGKNFAICSTFPRGQQLWCNMSTITKMSAPDPPIFQTQVVKSQL